jgi:hypothetical protein
MSDDLGQRNPGLQQPGQNQHNQGSHGNTLSWHAPGQQDHRLPYCDRNTPYQALSGARHANLLSRGSSGLSQGISPSGSLSRNCVEQRIAADTGQGPGWAGTLVAHNPTRAPHPHAATGGWGHAHPHPNLGHHELTREGMPPRSISSCVPGVHSQGFQLLGAAPSGVADLGLRQMPQTRADGGAAPQSLPNVHDHRLGQGGAPQGSRPLALHMPPYTQDDCSLPGDGLHATGSLPRGLSLARQCAGPAAAEAVDWGSVRQLQQAGAALVNPASAIEGHVHGGNHPCGPHERFSPAQTPNPVAAQARGNPHPAPHISPATLSGAPGHPAHHISPALSGPPGHTGRHISPASSEPNGCWGLPAEAQALGAGGSACGGNNRMPADGEAPTGTALQTGEPAADALTRPRQTNQGVTRELASSTLRREGFTPPLKAGFASHMPADGSEVSLNLRNAGCARSGSGVSASGLPEQQGRAQDTEGPPRSRPDGTPVSGQDQRGGQGGSGESARLPDAFAFCPNVSREESELAEQATPALNLQAGMPAIVQPEFEQNLRTSMDAEAPSLAVIEPQQPPDGVLGSPTLSTGGRVPGIEGQGVAPSHDGGADEALQNEPETASALDRQHGGAPSSWEGGEAVSTRQAVHSSGNLHGIMARQRGTAEDTGEAIVRAIVSGLPAGPDGAETTCMQGLPQGAEVRNTPEREFQAEETRVPAGPARTSNLLRAPVETVLLPTPVPAELEGPVQSQGAGTSLHVGQDPGAVGRIPSGPPRTWPAAGGVGQGDGRLGESGRILAGHGIMGGPEQNGDEMVTCMLTPVDLGDHSSVMGRAEGGQTDMRTGAYPGARDRGRRRQRGVRGRESERERETERERDLPGNQNSFVVNKPNCSTFHV